MFICKEVGKKHTLGAWLIINIKERSTKKKSQLSKLELYIIGETHCENKVPSKKNHRENSL